MSKSVRLAVTWLGHATALLELDGVALLTDPVLRNRIGPLVRIAAPVDSDSLHPIDGVLLSHLHADHADLPSLRSVARTAPVLAPDDAAGWLGHNGLEDVRGLRPGDAVTIGGVRVRATPALHGRGRRPLGPQADPLGYVASGGISVYFAGDTDLFPELEELRGVIEVALLPVWGWGTSLGPGHLDPERAARAAATIAPRVAIPIHWGTFAMSRPARRLKDPALPAREFAALVKRTAPAVEVHLLEPGERVEL